MESQTKLFKSCGKSSSYIAARNKAIEVLQEWRTRAELNVFIAPFLPRGRICRLAMSPSQKWEGVSEDMLFKNGMHIWLSSLLKSLDTRGYLDRRNEAPKMEYKFKQKES